MSLNVAIVGAGIVGRLLALKAMAKGWRVTLFDRGDPSGNLSCSIVPPAMLAPYCELDVAEPQIALWGAQGLAEWPTILAEFELDAFFQKAGSLVVAHPQDEAELVRFAHTISLRSTESNFSPVAREEIAALEPDLDAVFSTGLYFPREGQIDSRDVLKAMHQALIRGKVTLYFNQAVEVAPYIVRTAQDVQKFDMVFDCRGYGAANDLPNLRPVRGEIIRVYAPDVKLNRPIRLLHPRWPIYVVPRPNGHYIIGATAIESDDTSPISTRSLLELLSAALALNSGFSEARILETNVGLRPAFPDNMPRLLHQPGLIRANGLYRHGFLLAPVITEAACKLAETGKPHITHIGLIREAA